MRWGEADSQETARRLAMKAMTAGLPPGSRHDSRLDGLRDRAHLAPMGLALFMVKGDA